MSCVTSLNEETEAIILEAIRSGNYKSVACAKAGIHRDTLNGWELRAENGEEPFRSFVEKLREAEADAETKLLSEIRCAQPGVPGVSGADIWTAKAWILERRWPKRWAARVRQSVNEEIDAFTDRLKRRLNEDAFRQVLDAANSEEPSGEGAPRH
jgi:hypothetical protein